MDLKITFVGWGEDPEILSLEVRTPSAVETRFEIIDLAGESVQIHHLKLPRGEAIVSVEIGTLPPGTYGYRLMDGRVTGLLPRQ